MKFVMLMVLLGIPVCEAAKMPLADEKREFLVLHSPGKASGMFSVFLTVLGFLHFYESSDWAGIEVDFEKRGLYFDQEKGPNWWSYYFERVRLGDEKQGSVKVLSHRRFHKFNREASRFLSRETGSALIQKYIKIKPEIRKKVDDFVMQHFQGCSVIGVHYRGTDKKSEAKHVPYEKVFAEIRRVLAQLSSSKEHSKCKIFVATDEDAFLKQMHAEFKEEIMYIQAVRSKDGKAVHFAKENQYAIGEQALIDCLLLSRSDFLVRTPSNLSYSAQFFNPSLPVSLVMEGGRQ